jgi:hypothetical protein
MHHSDGGLSLSYNAQISTDAAHGLIVGVAVTQEANDSAQLLPAVDGLKSQEIPLPDKNSKARTGLMARTRRSGM